MLVRSINMHVCMYGWIGLDVAIMVATGAIKAVVGPVFNVLRN